MTADIGDKWAVSQLEQFSSVSVASHLIIYLVASHEDWVDCYIQKKEIAVAACLVFIFVRVEFFRVAL